MNSKVRRRELYEILKKKKEIQVADMAEMLGVSCMTIRRDLLAMEKEDLIIRSYGKAMLKNASANEISFNDRVNLNFEYKVQACQEAVKLLKGVSSLYIDGSTTCHTLSLFLPTNRNLTVVSSNLSASLHLRDMHNIQLVFPGGMLAADLNTIDTNSSQFIPSNYYVEMAFVSCGGFSENGVVDSNLSGSYIRNAMLNVAQSTVLIADHTKCRNHGLFSLWNWSKFTHFVTDKKPENSILAALERHGVQAHWASP